MRSTVRCGWNSNPQYLEQVADMLIKYKRVISVVASMSATESKGCGFRYHPRSIRSVLVGYRREKLSKQIKRIITIY